MADVRLARCWRDIQKTHLTPLHCSNLSVSVHLMSSLRFRHQQRTGHAPVPADTACVWLLVLRRFVMTHCFVIIAGQVVLSASIYITF